MEMENMTRGLGWRFLEFGRRLERAARIVQWFRAGLCPEFRAAPCWSRSWKFPTA